MTCEQPPKRGKVVNLYYPNSSWRRPRAAMLRSTAACARRFVGADRHEASDGEECRPAVVRVGLRAGANHADKAQAGPAFADRTLGANHFGRTRASPNDDRAGDKSTECRKRFKLHRSCET